MIVETEDLVMITDAAELLDVSRQSIDTFIKKNLLIPIEIGNKRFLSKKAILALKDKRANA